jgi:hypothetical protein
MIKYWLDWYFGMTALIYEINALRLYLDIQRQRIDKIEKRMSDCGI